MIDPSHVAFLTQRVELPLWFVLALGAYSSRRLLGLLGRGRSLVPSVSRSTPPRSSSDQKG